LRVSTRGKNRRGRSPLIAADASLPFGMQNEFVSSIGRALINEKSA
jgi:hypothetical protein